MCSERADPGYSVKIHLDNGFRFENATIPLDSKQTSLPTNFIHCRIFFNQTTNEPRGVTYQARQFTVSLHVQSKGVLKDLAFSRRFPSCFSFFLVSSLLDPYLTSTSVAGKPCQIPKQMVRLVEGRFVDGCRYWCKIPTPCCSLETAFMHSVRLDFLLRQRRQQKRSLCAGIGNVRYKIPTSDERHDVVVITVPDYTSTSHDK